ncbi:MAG: PBP1A family penicillin-binding protein [Hyphomonadaceae bacterium]|nr:PBP1A family penicillin-binding protein [Hyphomonadaceae bacterium]
MADENDPDRPEDDAPPGPPQGDDEASLPPEAFAPEPAPEEMVRETLFEEAAPEPEPEPEREIVAEAELEPEVEPEAEATAEPAPPPPEILPPVPDDLPIAAAEAHDELPEPPPAPVAAGSSEPELPANYFRAAGDPEEAQEEPPATLIGRLRERVLSTAQDIRRVVEPKWVAFAGAARAFGGEMWRRILGIKRPRNVREAAVWSGWLAAGTVAVIVAFFVAITWDLPSTDDLWEARQGQSVTFLDRNGHVILREGAQNAPPVDLASLPPYVAQAFVAIEDRRFYDHFGVDVGGMMRAGAENLRAGRVVQGGSTITQQLAKNLFLTNDRTWRRKFQEIAMAIWLEGRFEKREILALYLSRVYFGAGAYGIEAAAERYFDRPARELTLLQAAMIAGLVKAPSRLNPARQDIAAARDRARTVLDEMVNMQFISAAERDAALQEELVISRRNPAGVLSYYRDWIDPLLNDVIGQQRDDFVVETTLDIAAQRAGDEAVNAVLSEQGEARRVSQAALIAMDDEGGVRAIVGGRDYDQSQFNRATQARRQPGSSFKFFIYLAAMENGLTPWSVREDAPITINIPGQPSWTPGNYTNEYHGATELTRAFALSYNMVAIRVANEIGGQSVIDVARRLGVRSPLSNYHSLALGAQEITLLEMTQAYAAMASEGYNVQAHGITRIRRASSNETVWAFRQENRERVIEERHLRYMNYMMRRVVDAGTGTAARISGRQVGGKTGTGNDYRDAWFIGFVPGLVAGVWTGNDNFTETGRVTGGSLPTEIWARFMPTALRNTPTRELELPREEDYDTGVSDPEAPEITAVGAPIGAVIGVPPVTPPDTEDRSLDFGPEG